MLYNSSRKSQKRLFPCRDLTFEVEKKVRPSLYIQKIVEGLSIK